MHLIPPVPRLPRSPQPPFHVCAGGEDLFVHQVRPPQRHPRHAYAPPAAAHACALPRTSSPSPAPLPSLQTAIVSEGFRSLREGEAVEFVLETSDDGRQKAVSVTGPNGAAPEGAPRRQFDDSYGGGG